MNESLKSKISTYSKELGFVKVGFAKAEPCSGMDIFKDRFENRFFGEMKWLSKDIEKRFDPNLLFPKTKTVISLADSYYRGHSKFSGKVAEYALGYDYHNIMKKRLYLLLDYIKNINPKIEGKVCVDSSPILETYWAQKSGIGWIGKNNLIITKSHGSYLLLGELLLNIEMKADEPAKNNCGSCERCIKACPPNALKEPYTVDATRCISYLTIEKKGEYNEEDKRICAGHFYGCDICQDACPWNQNLTPSRIKDYDFPEFEQSLTKYLKSDGLINLKKRKTALERLNLTKLKENLKISQS